MAVYNREGLALLALTFLLLCCSSGSSIFFNELGVVTPNDPRPFVGENLTLFCNLTRHKIHENSSRLFFSHKGERISSQYVDIINSRTIRLRYPIRDPKTDEGLFVCYLDKVIGERETVGTQYVKADYKPVNVTSVNCTVYNWKNMTCKWDLRREYKYMDDIEVSLVWTISGIQKDCPILTKTSCTWPGHITADDAVDNLYLPGSVYIMIVEVLNKVRGVAAKSHPPFRIETNKFVKPDPVQDLRVSGKNASCLNLTWTHTDRMSRKLALVQYFSEWNQGNWTDLPLKPFRRGSVQVMICHLTPFTDYTIRIGVWPEGHLSERVGYRSDWEYMTTRTDASVPEVGPAMCSSCFTDLPSSQNQRKVIIYWRHIPWPLRYNTIRGYHLHIPDGSINSTVANCNFTDANNTSCMLALQPEYSYTLQLYAVTMQNELSRNFSSVFLTPVAQRPSRPGSFVVETHRQWTSSTGEFYMRWANEANTLRYMITWCRGSRTNQMCDDEPVWIELPGNATQYTLSVQRKGKNHSKKGGNQEDYLVGIAREVIHDGNVVSSGILWARCIYLRGEVPSPPENVNFAEVQRAGSLSVVWDRAECSTNNVYILYYVVYFCKIDSNNKCKAKGWKVNVTDNNSVLLDKLEQGTYYRVSVSAVSEWGEGQQSQPPIFAKVTTEKQIAESKNYAVIGVILGVFVIIILILIGICKLRRHYIKNREKFGSLGNLPPLPHAKSFTEKEPSNFQNRPLPQIPPQSSSSGATATTSGCGSDLTHSNNHRNRNGKHKSITSETSLLGHEDSFITPDDDSRRRHRSGTSGTSEKAKLLPEEESVPQDKHVSKYDSDSGAESRYSSDHDYASVDSGGNGSGKSLPREDSDGVNAACGYRKDGKAVPCKDGVDLGDKGGKQRPHKATSGHLPYPAHQRGDYILASLSTSDSSPFPNSPPAGTGASGLLQQQERQPLLATFGPGQPLSHMLPAHQAKACDSSGHGHVMAPTPYEPAHGSGFIDDRTLPLRTHGARHKNIAETELDSLAIAPTLTPAPSSSTAAKVQHPQIPMDRSVLSMVEMVPQHPPSSRARGYTPQPAIPAVHTAGYGGGASGRSVGGEPSEPIYSPPWGSNGLISVVTDNRPLSEYMLQLPQNFFQEPAVQVHEGPTTEL